MSNNKSCKRTSIGGQALIEGIMMRGPEKTAMAVRNPAGEIVIEEYQTKASKVFNKVKKIPFVRGLFGFADSLITGYKSLMRSAEIAGLDDEEPTKKDKAVFSVAMVIAIIIGVALAIGLFMYVPSLIAKLVFGEEHFILASVVEGLIKIALIVGYMFVISFMKDIHRVFMYHGAEHKTIACYEKNLPLTVENVREQRRFHPRCGTSFIILMMLVSIFVSIIVKAVAQNALALPIYVAIRILLLPLVVGCGYELIKFAGRHDNLISKIISAPGVWLQHITTKEPDDSMIECAIAAMKRVIPDDGSDTW